MSVAQTNHVLKFILLRVQNCNKPQAISISNCNASPTNKSFYVSFIELSNIIDAQSNVKCDPTRSMNNGFEHGLKRV